MYRRSQPLPTDLPPKSTIYYQIHHHQIFVYTTPCHTNQHRRNESVHQRIGARQMVRAPGATHNRRPAQSAAGRRVQGTRGLPIDHHLFVAVQRQRWVMTKCSPPHPDFRHTGVRIQIAGQARTRWNERVHRFVDGRPEKKELFYQADETFLDSKAYLRKGADDGSATGKTAIVWFERDRGQVKDIGMMVNGTRTKSFRPQQ